MSQTLPTSPAVAAQGPVVIASRFGEITVDPASAISFTRGLLGMPDRQRFVLTNFPSEKLRDFMLLQSLEDAALSFICLPILAGGNPFIEREDIAEIGRALHIADSDLAMLLIVSVHRQPDQVKLSVNVRAPLVIDAQRRLGVQHVFQHDRYKVQHML